MNSKPLVKKNSTDTQRIPFARYPIGPVQQKNSTDIDFETTHYKQYDVKYSGKEFNLLIEHLKLLSKGNLNKLQITKKEQPLENYEREAWELASQIVNNQDVIKQVELGLQFPKGGLLKELPPQDTYMNRGKLKILLQYLFSQLMT